MVTPVFRFEREADPEDRWIPMAVRMKLDLAGLKIGLEQWGALDPQARDDLCAAPADCAGEIDAFARLLRGRLAEAGAKGPEALAPERLSAVSSWRDGGEPPAAVAELLARCGFSAVWGRLDRFGRYVVAMLAKKNDSERLAAALAELGLAAGQGGTDR